MSFLSRSKWWRTYAASLLVCAGLTAGAYFFGIEPALAERDRVTENDAELARRRDSAAEMTARLESTRQDLEHARQAVVSLPLHLEPAANVNGRLARLADLAVAATITVDEVQPEPARDGSHYQIVPIRIAGTGSYVGCAAFFHRLRENFPDTGVKSFEIVTQHPAAEGAVGTLRIELEWYAAPAHK